MLSPHQFVARPAGIGYPAAEGLALAIHVAIGDLLWLTAPNRYNEEINVSDNEAIRLNGSAMRNAAADHKLFFLS